MSKRINSKILRIRSQPTQAFNIEKIKDSALEQMHSSGSINKMRQSRHVSQREQKKSLENISEKK